jgi:hypothetical protein
VGCCQESLPVDVNMWWEEDGVFSFTPLLKRGTAPSKNPKDIYITQGKANRFILSLHTVSSCCCPRAHCLPEDQGNDITCHLSDGLRGRYGCG